MHDTGFMFSTHHSQNQYNYFNGKRQGNNLSNFDSHLHMIITIVNHILSCIDKSILTSQHHSTLYFNRGNGVNTPRPFYVRVGLSVLRLWRRPTPFKPDLDVLRARSCAISKAGNVAKQTSASLLPPTGAKPSTPPSATHNSHGGCSKGT